MSANNKKTETLVSRRNFVKHAGFAVGGAVVGGVLGTSMTKIFFDRSIPEPAPVQPPVPEEPKVPFNQALMFFNMEQYELVEAATERIFPEDEHGPGAKKLGVAFFIDHQLAGQWGLSSKEYMTAPFYPGEPTQGYQAPMNRQQIFEIGLKGMQTYSLQQYNKKFVELTAEEQDEVLTAFQEGNVPLPGITSSFFFSMLRTATLEGVYADPLYGGNANMDGWRMKKYPGDYMSYAHIIESEEFVLLEPRSLRDHVHGH